MRYSSIEKQSGVVDNREGLPIYYDLYTPVTTPDTVFPVILFVHGFKGFKDWGAFPDAMEDLARAGFAVLSFNLSKNGVGESMDEFDQPELFEEQTLTGDLNDIGDVIEAIKSKDINHDKFVLNTDKIGIIGHSRGGHTAVVAAAEYSDIRVLVTWSAVADYNARWSEEMKSDWNKKGYTEIKNARTGEILKLGKTAFDDAQKNSDRLMAIKRIKELHIPVMVIAGKKDEAVHHSDSEKLYRTCPANDKEIRLIENAGHTFEVSHPFELDDYPKEFVEVLDFTEGWFLEYLT